jgi:hypothetical protein
MAVERRDEPLDERQRRTAQLHGLAEFRASLELDMACKSSRPANDRTARYFL